MLLLDRIEVEFLKTKVYQYNRSIVRDVNMIDKYIAKIELFTMHKDAYVLQALA